jgi:hypothetical protein
MVKSRFKNVLLAATASAALLSAGAANASVLLTFDEPPGLKNQEDILNYYNGGTGSLGSGPGPSDGVTFSSSALASISTTAGGTGNFNNNPPLSGHTANFSPTADSEVISSTTAFTNGVSLYYSSDSFALSGNDGSVKIYSSSDGTGSPLATLDLPDTGNNGPSGTHFNMWDQVSVSFSGNAQSVVLTGAAQHIGYDNITLGAVPAPIMGQGLPSGLAVAGMLFGAKLLQRSRRRRSLGVGIPNAV